MLLLHSCLDPSRLFHGDCYEAVWPWFTARGWREDSSLPTEGLVLLSRSPHVSHDCTAQGHLDTLHPIDRLACVVLLHAVLSCCLAPCPVLSCCLAPRHVLSCCLAPCCVLSCLTPCLVLSCCLAPFCVLSCSFAPCCVLSYSMPCVVLLSCSMSYVVLPHAVRWRRVTATDTAGLPTWDLPGCWQFWLPKLEARACPVTPRSLDHTVNVRVL